MRDRFYIVDDFYGNPDKLVDAAFDAVEAVDSVGNYAGRMTDVAFMAPQIQDYLKQLLMEPSVESSTKLNGRIRFTQQGDSFKQHIHFDAGIHHRWSGVVYLSKEHPEVDGTCFWKHKRTGLEQVPLTHEGLEEQGWHTAKDLQKFLETEGVDESKWTKTMVVPYRYNRLVLFRPWVFHSPGPSFGDSLQSSRLVQTIFLRN